MAAGPEPVTGMTELWVEGVRHRTMREKLK